MSRSTILTAGGLIFTVATAPSCSEAPLGPLDGRTYTLQEVDGAALPITITPAPGVSFTLLADTLRFFGGDSYSRTLVFEHGDRQVGQAKVRTEIMEGTVVRRAGAYILEFVCEDVIIVHTSMCVPPDTARIMGTGRLLVRSFLTPPGQKLFVSSGA